ncbi:hypothetical protein J7390_00215 [Xanthomonas phaseoli pv. manihotis]|uniref:hypothetical protein n=1 Tax=Xanthomonas phaseoli TaxID=1985254 RepID=UPI000A6D0C2B|nr:hypothetical protein [Xanthomonas phaseoli]MBO9718570.1 hypothetical protein [Xanthomonas phaseoli pv. manihotis]
MAEVLRVRAAASCCSMVIYASSLMRIDAQLTHLLVTPSEAAQTPAVAAKAICHYVTIAGVA